MSCTQCEFLRSKLSPFEDKAFTAEFLRVQPPAEWYRNHTSGGRRGVEISIRLPELWEKTFGTKGNMGELTTLGRTLSALGWQRTYKTGELYFIMQLEEFDDNYNTRVSHGVAC